MMKEDSMKDLEGKRPPLVIIAGPTAVGKSAAAVMLARRIDGEVISADSMQVYRGMDIGTAKLKKEEMMGVPHHMIDVADPTEAFDAACFQEMALECVDDVIKRGRIPILAGGTGFYVQAVRYRTCFAGDAVSPLRLSLEEEGRRDPYALHERLRAKDPAYAGTVHPNNVRRVARALSFFYETGSRLSEHNEEERGKESPFNSVLFFLDDERDRLYERIDRRVDRMIEDGLEDEVKRLKEAGCTRQSVSMQALGYKEILSVLEGEMTLDKAVELIKRDTRRFSKRQRTWFIGREKDAVCLSRKDYETDGMIVDKMLEILREKGII